MNKKDLPFIVVIIGLGVGITYLQSLAVKGVARPSVLYFIAAYLRCAIIVLVCVWLAKKYKFIEQGGFRGFKPKNYWMLLIPLIFPGMVFTIQPAAECQVSAGYFITAFMFICANALTEEVMFRGAIHGYLRKQHPEINHFKISIIASLLFSLIHLLNLSWASGESVAQQLVYAFFTGLIFSALLIRTGNIWFLGIIHALLNLISSSCNLFPTSIMITNTHEQGNLLVNMGMMILIFSPLAFLSWALLYTIPRKKVNGSLYIGKP